MSDVEMVLEEIMRRHEQQEQSRAAPEFPLTEEQLVAFIDNPVWKVMQHLMKQYCVAAQAVRDKENVTRDSERMHLGIQRGLSEFLNWPQKTLDNHKQTQSEENRHE